MGTGVRRSELARLKITDIDSQRMIIHIQGGKDRKDRGVMLSPKLLKALREYWRGLRRKPTDCLFPSGRWHTALIPSAPRPSGMPAKRPPSGRVSARKSTRSCCKRWPSRVGALQELVPDGDASKELPVPKLFRRSAPNAESDEASAPACWTSRFLRRCALGWRQV